jgi:predicted hotdog family 3-hydroxylacyl-ACP dehydratase
MMTEEKILELIPQRPPFVMIDELTYSDGKSSRSSFLIKEKNIFVSNGKFREAGLVENIAQTAAARAGYNSQQENKPVLVGYIGAVKNLEIFALPKINDVLETEVAIENQVFDVTIITGKVKCNGILLAQCEMRIFIVQPPK